ncbi:unnamed protein product [Cunninghamella blakesleeana]
MAKSKDNSSNNSSSKGKRSGLCRRTKSSLKHNPSRNVFLFKYSKRKTLSSTDFEIRRNINVKELIEWKQENPNTLKVQQREQTPPLTPPLMENISINMKEKNNENRKVDSINTSSSNEPILSPDQYVWAILESQTNDIQTCYLREADNESITSIDPQRYIPKRSGYQIGSHESCDIRIPSLEPHHASIYMRWCDQGQGLIPQVFIYERSTKHTFINHVLVKPRTEVKLNNEDNILFGSKTQNKVIWFKLHIPPRSIEKKSYGNKSIDELYKSVKPLGNGAFGEVYLAKCSSTDRLVAIKVVKTNLDKNDIQTQSLIQEISTNMSLGAHPCIVKIEKVMEERLKKGPGKESQIIKMYIIMEPAQHGDLFTLVESTGISEPEVSIVFDQIFHGTAYLHHRGVVHRDLKLENIVITDINHLHVKICDFGLATFEYNGSVLDTVCGTREYAAPELLINKMGRGNGDGYTKAVDIWSLGVMLYTALFRQAPFTSKIPDESLLARLKEGVKFVHTNISENAQDLIKKMLTFDPTKRPTIDQVLDHPWIRDFATGKRAKPLQQHFDKLSANTPPITPS